jgi:hypothetical protein
MNGRCENNALDAAFDVCDACGGEYCQSCLLFPKGMKKAPLCKTCAIASSGVRNRAKRDRMQSRSEANKRRKELRAIAREEQANKVVRAEDLPDYEFAPAEHVVEEKPKKKRLRRKGDHAAVEPDDDETLEQQESETVEPKLEPVLEMPNPESASKRLHEIRANGEVEQAWNEEADVWNFPTDYDKPRITVVEASEPPAKTKPNWEPLHNPDASNPFDDPSAGSLRGDFSARRTTAFPAPDTNIGPMHDPESDRRGQPIATQRPRHRNTPRIPIDEFTPEPAAQHSPPAPPAPQASDLAAGPAPLVRPEEKPKKKKKRSLLPSRAKDPVVVPEEAAQERIQDPTTDTDAAGQWIPPNLRGMVASEAQTELPKRRRKGE